MRLEILFLAEFYPGGGHPWLTYVVQWEWPELYDFCFTELEALIEVFGPLISKQVKNISICSHIFRIIVNTLRALVVSLKIAEKGRQRTTLPGAGVL